MAAPLVVTADYPGARRNIRRIGRAAAAGFRTAAGGGMGEPGGQDAHLTVGGSVVGGREYANGS